MRVAAIYDIHGNLPALEAVLAAELTLVTLPATLTAHLRASDLPRLRASGPVGQLLARQSEVHARDQRLNELARAHAGLPDDLLNFHYADPTRRYRKVVTSLWQGASTDVAAQKVVQQEKNFRDRRRAWIAK